MSKTEKTNKRSKHNINSVIIYSFRSVSFQRKMMHKKIKKLLKTKKNNDNPSNPTEILIFKKSKPEL